MNLIFHVIWKSVTSLSGARCWKKCNSTWINSNLSDLSAEDVHAITPRPRESRDGMFGTFGACVSWHLRQTTVGITWSYSRDQVTDGFVHVLLRLTCCYLLTPFDILPLYGIFAETHYFFPPICRIVSETPSFSRPYTCFRTLSLFPRSWGVVSESLPFAYPHMHVHSVLWHEPTNLLTLSRLLEGYKRYRIH